MRTTLLTLAALVIGGMSTAANAVSVYLTPESQNVTLGDQVAVQLWWDFTGDATLGGGTDFAWDSSGLSLASIVFDDNPDFDPSFTRCDNEVCWGDGFIDGLATGNFDGLADPGPILIATITFDTLAAGAFLMDISEDDNIAGPFVSARTFNTYPDLQFGDATINVSSGVVPVPAAIWLMIGGLGTLLGYRRKS
jgi:hypothetical protein